MSVIDTNQVKPDGYIVDNLFIIQDMLLFNFTSKILFGKFFLHFFHLI